MNLSDGSFLVLDIGAYCVRAWAARIMGGRITASDIQTCQSFDTVYALKSAVDALEGHIGRHFDSAFVTGNFGFAKSDLVLKKTAWPAEHKISAADVHAQVVSALPEIGADMAPVHIIPMRYDVSGFPNILSPIGQIDRRLTSAFCILSAEKDGVAHIQNVLRKCHIEPGGFYDPMFILGRVARPQKQPAIMIDLGASWASLSVWTVRGPVFSTKIPMGMGRITDAIASEMDITWAAADRIKCANMSAAPSDMDRFTPADSEYDFSRADINDIAMPILVETVDIIAQALAPYVEKYLPAAVYLSGGGSAIDGIDGMLSAKFNLPVNNLGPDAAITNLASFVWGRQTARVNAYLARRARVEKIFSFIPKIFRRKKKKRPSFIPIMPSSTSFDLADDTTYKMFDSAGISMIHCDIMDGFYVDNIAGSIDWLRNIRSRTRDHLHVHLMTESPVVWAEQAVGAGADTVILSTGTAGVRAALKKVQEMGKRAGIALHPNTPIDVLKPILREIDEILVMSVVPGAGGQMFLDEAVNRISTLYNTRRRYNLKFKISVDGGINADTAARCWDAGADFLVSGNYLAKSPDFRLAVQSLLKK